MLSDEEIKVSHDYIVNNYVADVINTLRNLPVAAIGAIADVIAAARLQGKHVFIFGNGGSAATAAHWACDLAKGAIADNLPRIKAVSLCDNVSVLSAWANDYSYDHIFDEQLKNLIEEDDVVIAVSGSGNSANVLNGIELAKTKGATTIGLCGFDGGKLAELVDIALIVSSDCMEQVEDIHLLIEHVITTCLRKMG